jgi:hypothetical protein
MNSFIFSYAIEMAAASVDSNNRYHLKFKQPVRTVNGRNVYLIPQGIPNNENNENNENNKNRQYEKYRSYIGHLKDSMKQLNEIFRREILRNEDIIGAPDGIYTWIIKNDTFYAIRVFTQQEIGTLHLDLDRYTRDEEGNISSAGELKLEKPTIEFNIQSGTYTAKINGFQLDDIERLFGELQGTTLFNQVQQDANDITNIIKGNKDPEIVEITEDKMKTLLRKRVPEKIKPIQRRIKNRIMLYKRDRMIEDVRSKICSFFRDKECSNVKFIYSGSENHATINSAFIETGDVGHEFEVTAGKSLLVHPKLEYKPIVTTQANLNILTKNRLTKNGLTKNGLFKEGRIRNFMSRRHYPTKPNLNNTTNTKKRRISGK